MTVTKIQKRIRTKTKSVEGETYGLRIVRILKQVYGHVVIKKNTRRGQLFKCLSFALYCSVI